MKKVIDVGIELLAIKTILFAWVFVVIFGIPLPFIDDDDDDDDGGYGY